MSRNEPNGSSKGGGEKPDALLSEAMRHHTEGELYEAEVLYRRVLESWPDNPDALHGLGLIALQTHNPQPAVELIARAAAAKPSDPAILGHLGLAQLASGRRAEAELSYRNALALDPNHLDSRINLGNLLLQGERFAEAENEFRAALACDPKNPMVRYGLGLIALAQDQTQAAIESFIAALDLAPDLLAARINLANLLLATGRAAEAVEQLREAVRRAPDSFDARLNLGVALQQVDRPAEAVKIAEETLDLAPESPELLLNLGAAHLANGNPEAACEALDRALKIAPDYAPARLNRAMARLISGDFAGGWKDYESRPSRGVLPHPAIAGIPEWTGEDPAGRTILVWAEQGYGDTIQFSRYLPMLAARGARVLFNVPPPLARLFEDFPGIERVIVRDRERELPAADLQIPLLSLPLRFATTLETIPSQTSYLRAGPTKRRRRRRRRVGLCWQGSRTNPNDHRRSIDPDSLVAALEKPGVELVGLQYGIHEAPIDNPGGEVTDFHEMARLIADVDLVVSVDTGVAHLAGALGRPVWTLLPFAPDWRWLLHRDDSPWYPTMRLFRQPAPGDWPAVFDKIAKSLDEWLDR